MSEYRGLTEAGKWVYGDILNVQGKVYICNTRDIPVEIFYYDKPNGERINILSSLCTALVKVIPETVGMFTGLKDENKDENGEGKDVYGGDIVEFEYYDTELEDFINTGEVYFNSSRFAFCLRRKGKLDITLEGYRNCKVIGNIHENQSY